MKNLDNKKPLTEEKKVMAGVIMQRLAAPTQEFYEECHPQRCYGSLGAPNTFEVQTPLPEIVYRRSYLEQLTSEKDSSGVEHILVSAEGEKYWTLIIGTNADLKGRNVFTLNEMTRLTDFSATIEREWLAYKKSL